MSAIAEMDERAPVTAYTDAEWARALSLGLALPETEKVAWMLAEARQQAEAAWVERMDRAVARQQELLAQRDHAERLLDRLEQVVTAPCYLVRGKRQPRYAMNGREVLAVLEERRR